MNKNENNKTRVLTKSRCFCRFPIVCRQFILPWCKTAGHVEKRPVKSTDRTKFTTGRNSTRVDRTKSSSRKSVYKKQKKKNPFRRSFLSEPKIYELFIARVNKTMKKKKKNYNYCITTGIIEDNSAGNVKI